MFSFDHHKYERELKRLGNEALRQKEREKRRKVYGDAAGVGISIGAIPFSLGITVLTGLYAAHCLDEHQQKLHIIQRELYLRGVPPYDATRSDWWVPVGTRVAAAWAGGGVAHGADALIGAPVAHGISASSLGSAFHQHPTAAVMQGLSSGLNHDSSSLSNAVQGHPSNASWNLSGNPYYQIGEQIGAVAPQEAAQHTVERVAEWIGDHIPGRHHHHPSHHPYQAGWQQQPAQAYYYPAPGPPPQSYYAPPPGYPPPPGQPPRYNRAY